MPKKMNGFRCLVLYIYKKNTYILTWVDSIVVMLPDLYLKVAGLILLGGNLNLIVRTRFANNQSYKR